MTSPPGNSGSPGSEGGPLEPFVPGGDPAPGIPLGSPHAVRAPAAANGGPRGKRTGPPPGSSGPGAAVASPVLIAIWYLWLPVAWLLPILLILLRFASGGWETLILMMVSPGIVPAVALLAALPRFILRRQSWRHAPASVAALMIASAWGLAFLSLATRGTGDSGTIDSPLGEILPGLSERSENQLAMIGMILALTSYVAALVVTCVLAARSPRSGDPDPLAGQPRKPGWWVVTRELIPIAALLLVPLLAAGVNWVGISVMRDGPKDFAGRSEGQVVALDEAAFAASRDQAWDRLQRQAAPVRAGIAGDGWLVAAGGGERAVTGNEPERYRLVASWEVLRDEAPERAAGLALRAAETHGWKLDLRDAASPVDPLDPESSADAGSAEWDDADEAGVVLRKGYRLRNDDGYVLMVRAAIPVSPSNDARVAGTPVPKSYLRVEVTSGVYWEGNRSVSLNIPTWGDSPEGQKLWSSNPPAFRASEWPDFLAVESGWSRERQR